MNSSPPLLDSFMNPSKPNTDVEATATYGTPPLVDLVSILGAEFSCANPTRMRDPLYTFEFAALSTTVKRTALMMPGKTGTPAS